MLRALLYIGSAGGIGGLFYSITGFHVHTAKGNFNEKFIWWYVLRPFLSIILGLIVYFLLLGGLLFTTGTVPSPENIQEL